MRNYIYYFGLIILLVSCNQNKTAKTKEQDKAISAESKSETVFELEKLAGGFKFTEGPAVDAAGNVYFSDVAQSMTLIWTIEEQLDTIRTNTGRGNGLYFDKNSNLLTCEMETGKVTSTSPSGEYNVLAATYKGKRFNEPNDLWPDGKGGIYFSDPKYGKNDKELTQDGMHVYFISPDHTSVTRVIDDFEKPNGLIGTPDGKTLYVTDAQAEKTYKYDIQEDGSLANKTLFVTFGCDGMTIDNAGNVYLTTSGKQNVDIFSPKGDLLKTIDIPERPTNVCFGGKDRNQLYITARTSIYRVKLDTKGVD